MKIKKILSIIMVGIMVIALGACSPTETTTGSSETVTVTNSSKSSSEGETTDSEELNNETTNSETTNQEVSTNETSTNLTVYESSLLDTEDMFSNRDLEQEVDLDEATYVELESNQEVIINEEGVYVLSGDVSETMIIVEAEDEAKVQLVLDGVSITNEDMPAIYVKSGDKVWVTTTDSVNELSVTDDYEADGDVNLDAVIYSKSDLVLNGTGVLNIVSEEGNGVTSKDDLKVTGGTLDIISAADGLEANDSIRVYDGDITIVTDKDGLHSENEDDLALGYIYIAGGTLTITSADDAIHGTSVVQIDGGTINIPECVEGIEGTYILINAGVIDIYSTDDGINATSLSNSYDVVIEVNGGDITIDMASGDTDAFDANGDIVINGGNIDLICGSSFDANNSAVLNGGTVIVNGEEISEITSSQQGGRKKG